MRARKESRQVKTGGALSMFAGFWLIVTPWVFGPLLGAPLEEVAGSVSAGTAVIILTLVYFDNPDRAIWAGGLICVIGIAVVASPWLFGYGSDTGRTWNAVITGVVNRQHRCSERSNRVPLNVRRTAYLICIGSAFLILFSHTTSAAYAQRSAVLRVQRQQQQCNAQIKKQAE